MGQPEHNPPHPVERKPALCVDLDHTLIRTDILWECAIQLWRRPFVAASAFLTLITRGKAAFKGVLARSTHIDPARLPYREEVLRFATEEARSGREVVLATATHQIIALRIADHLGLFSKVIATDDEDNLSGVRKQAALEAAFGRNGFDYIGDSKKDLPIFAAAHHALLVNPTTTLFKSASEKGNVAQVFAEDRSRAKSIVRALRLHQWVKNILLAVPLFAAHQVWNVGAWLDVIVAFCSFGLVASATYLVNDLVDIQSDRIHPKKRFRPLASGQLAIPVGIGLAIVLVISGFALSISLLPSAYTAYLVVYVLLTLGYSFVLKRRLLVDVLALAFLYTLRILAGGVAIGMPVSEWLLMFSLFIFFSLAFLKRVIELKDIQGNTRMSGRGYSPLDLETMRIIGVSSGLVSVLVLSLYINSPAVSLLYRAPQVLWLICPLLIYWIARIWFLAARGEVHHDPVVFALSDWRSYVVGGYALVIAFFAKVGLSVFPW